MRATAEPGATRRPHLQTTDTRPRRVALKPPCRPSPGEFSKPFAVGPRCRGSPVNLVEELVGFRLRSTQGKRDAQTLAMAHVPARLGPRSTDRRPRRSGGRPEA